MYIPNSESYTVKELQDDFETKRNMVSKEIGKRMIEGWTLLDASCPHCVMPLMMDTEGTGEICVLCGLIEKMGGNQEEEAKQEEEQPKYFEEEQSKYVESDSTYAADITVEAPSSAATATLETLNAADDTITSAIESSNNVAEDSVKDRSQPPVDDSEEISESVVAAAQKIESPAEELATVVAEAPKIETQAEALASVYRSR
jgi:uncharacterized Zn finger protein (UPF0148 family)